MTEQAKSHSWSVLTVTKNTPWELMRFVAWHLEAGAETVYLVFHDENDPNQELVRANPRVKSIPMTRELCKDMGIEFDLTSPPQLTAGTHVYPDVTTDWLLRIDCDELLYCRDFRFGDFLATVPEHAQTVVIRPVETVTATHAKDRLFVRSPMTPDIVEQVYGDQAHLMLKRQGLISHAFGKSAHRTGIEGLQVQEHNAILPGGTARTKNVKMTAASGCMLVHFNSDEVDAWVAASVRRSQNSSFGPDLSRKIAEHTRKGGGDPSNLADMYRDLNSFDAAQTDQMVALGVGHFLDMKIDAAVQKHFPGARNSSEGRDN